MPADIIIPGSGGGGGSGTVTNTGGALTANELMLGAGGNDSKVAAGFTTDGVSTLTLGVPGTSMGNLVLSNSAAGSITLRSPTGAIGNVMVVVPATTDTLINGTSSQSLTNKTISGANNTLTVRLASDVTTTISGIVKGNGSGIVAATAGTDYLTPTGNGSGLTSLNASSLSSGTVPTAQLSAPLQAVANDTGALNLGGTTLTIPFSITAGSGTVLFPAGGTVQMTTASGAGLTSLNASSISSGLVSNARGGTGFDSSASTGIAQVSAGTWSFSNTIASPTLSGIVTESGTLVQSASAMGALAINVAQINNTKSISADSTFTFSGTPANAYQLFGMLVTNTDTNPHTLTIPSSFSLNSEAAITSVVIPASGKLSLMWQYDGANYNIFGDPVGVTGIGNFVLSNGGTLIAPNLGTPASGNLANCTGAVVAGGGTGVATLTAYAPIFGGTTTTGAVQSGTVGTTGQVLTSNGASALPTFQQSGKPIMTLNTTGTITFNTATNTETVYNTSGSTITTATITLPATSTPGQILRYVTAGIITTVTVSGTVDIGTPLTTLGANGSVAWQADATTGHFIRLY